MAKKKTTATAKTKTTKTKTTRTNRTGPMTKSQLVTTIAERAGMTKRQVTDVFTHLAATALSDLSKKGPGVFTIPGLAKMVVKTRPARPAKRGINPFTGQEMMFKAKPARNVVKVLALKKLKAMVS